MMDDDKVTIDREFFNELVANSNFLDALEAAGVDNWEGYEIAKEEMY
jgi:hypothetical protein